MAFGVEIGDADLATIDATHAQIRSGVENVPALAVASRSHSVQLTVQTALANGASAGLGALRA